MVWARAEKTEWIHWATDLRRKRERPQRKFMEDMQRVGVTERDALP